MKKTIGIRLIAIVVGVIGTVLLIRVRNTLVGRGLNADATGTSGYTTGQEFGLLALGVVLLILSIVVFSKANHYSK